MNEFNYNYMQGYGGYPQGYPSPYYNQMNVNPNSNYSPFMAPPVSEPVNGYVPGGQTVIPQSAPPEGIVPGSIPQSMQQNGYYNPYIQYNTAPPLQQNMMHNTAPGYNMNPALAYMQTGYNPYYNNPWNNQYYQQQQIEMEIEAEMYGNACSTVDPFECVRDSILTEEEKERRRKNINQYQYYNYYGNLQNGNPYDRNQIRNEEFEKARQFYIDFFTTLSMMAHNYCGDKVDEEELRRRYDPVKQAPQQDNYYSLTPEQKEVYQDYQVVERAALIPLKVMQYDMREAQLNERRALAYKKIKESHDKLLGIKEGEKITLEKYLANAGVLVSEAMMYEQRQRDKDASRKYSNSAFRQVISNTCGQSLPVTDCNDEFIPLEQRLKERYKSQKQSFIRALDGSLTPTVPPPDSPYDEQRNQFVQSLMKGMKL